MSRFDVDAYLKRKREKEEEKKNAYSPSSSASSNTKSNRFDVDAYLHRKKVNFDTFSDDLNSMNSTLNGIYSGWQDADTMASTKSKVEETYKRLLGYEDYRSKYGSDDWTDLSELVNTYKGALDEWDVLSENYSYYKSADEFNLAVEKQKKKEEEAAKLDKEMREADLDAVQTEISSLEEMYAKTKEYDKNVYQQKVYRNAEGYKAAQKERDDYLASIGYSSVDELEKAVSDKKKFVRDASVLQNEDKSLKSEDFEKYSTIGANIENPSYNEALPGLKIGPWTAIEGKEIGNKIKFAKDNIDDVLGSRSSDRVDSPVSSYLLEANEDEQRVYEYYIGQEAEGLVEKGTADKYLDSILPRLKARYEEGQLTQLDEFAHGGFWAKTGASALSVMYSLGGAVEHIGDSINYAKTGIMDDNFNARASSTIRNRVSQDVDWEIGKWDAFDFVYNTGMSMADSAAVMWMPGGSGAVVLGLSAAGQGVNDALDRGLDSKQAFWNGFYSGCFEMAFEKFSIGNFKAFKDMSVDGLKAGFKNLGKTMLVNASEETLTELANIAYDTVAHGDLSNYAIRVQELVDLGMSEADAKRKVALEFGGQVLEAGLSGAFMGIGFGTVGNISAAHNTKAIGKSITANENVGKVFDMASISPDASTAYEAYTQYANKGITAENAKTRQVGALALNLKKDAYDTLNDKNSTEAQREQAMKALGDLEAYSQNTSVSRYGKGRVKELFGDKKKVNALIEDALTKGENTEVYELATEYKAKLDSGKELSEKELTKLVDATTSEVKGSTRLDVEKRLVELGETENATELSEILSKASVGQKLSSAEIEMLESNENARKVFSEMDKSFNVELMEAAKGMNKGDAELFINTYDGHTDVDYYTDSFNLVKDYAKDNYSVDFILENSHGLTPRQVQQIYNKVVTEPRMAQQRRLDELVAKYEGNRERKAVIDDSIFNGAKGQKLWRSLTTRQKQAIMFAKAFAKGAGINLKITYNGKLKGKEYNGYYDPKTNTIVIDARAGVGTKMYGMKDAIIPTLSHELTHWMKQKSPELYAELSKTIFNVLEKKDGLTEHDRIALEIAKYKKNHNGEEMSVDAARDEIIARACEDLFAMSEEGRKIFNSLSEAEQKTLRDKIKDIIKNLVDWVNELLGTYESKSYEAKALRDFKEELSEISKMWDKMLVSSVDVNAALETEGIRAEELASEQKSDDVVQFADRNGDIKKAEELSETDFRFLLEQAQYGVLEDSSYIPMRISTPEFFRDVVYEHSEGKITVMDVPLASKVEHVRQNMEEDDGTSYGESRPHNLSVDDIVTISEEMGHPAYIVLQQNGRYAMVVSFYNSRKKKVVVSIDFASDKEPTNNYKYRQYMNGYNEGYYNIIVTQYEPDNFEHYLEGCEIVYDKKKMNGRYQVGSGRVVTFTHDTPFINNSILNSSENSNKQNVNNEDIQFSEKDYSYNSLVAKSDMKLTLVGENVPSNRADIVQQAIKNAKAVGYTNENGNAVVRVDDIKTDVIVPKKSIVHGLDRRMSSQAPVMVKIGEVLENAIRVNELVPRSENAKNTYVLIGSAVNKTNELYIASFVVNRFTNEVAEIDVLYSANAKKESAALLPKITDKSATPTDSAISIADLLEYVNRYFPDILPESVLRHYGHTERPDGTLGESVLFSEKDYGTSAYDVLGEAERLRKENAKLDADAIKFKEILGNEEIPNKRFLALANYLKKTSGSNMDSVELARRLKDAYTSMQTSKELKWEDVAMRTFDIAESLMGNDLGVPVEYFKNVMYEIRKDKISLTEEQRVWAEKRFGGYGNFHKYVFGRANIVKEGTSLEDAWKTWAEKHPSLFDSDMHGEAQIEAFVELVDAIKETSSIMGEYERSEAIRHLSTEVYNQFWNIATDNVTDSEVKTKRAQHRALMENLKKDYEKRQKDLAVHPVGETALKYEGILTKIRDSKRKEIFKAKQLGRERLAQYRENAERKTRIQRITKHAKTLIDWYETNSKDKHIHDSLKEPVKDLILAIDFSSKQLLGLDGTALDKRYTPTKGDISMTEALERLRKSIDDFKGADDIIDEMKESELPKRIAELLKTFEENQTNVGTESFVLNKMTAEELRRLEDIIRNVKSVVINANKFQVSHRNANAIQKGEESIAQLDARAKTFEDNKKRFGQNMDMLKSKIYWNNLNPYYAFKNMGEAAQGIFEAFMDGDDKFIALSDNVEEFSRATWTAKESKAWRKEYFDFDITKPDGKKVKISMNVPQIMSLYCVTKQEDAKKHILHGKEDYSGKGITLTETKKTSAVIDNIPLTEAQLNEIIGVLDDKSKVGRAKEVADAIQEYMCRVGSKLGNEITMARWGIKCFGIENYFPIRVSRDTVNDGGEAPKTIRTKLIALLNASFTHARNNYANNSAEIGDIFDVFSTHMSDMILYNSYALPLLDMYKWMNYKSVDDSSNENSVRRAVTKTFGEAGWDYLNKFLEDVGGTTKTDSRDNIGMKLFRKAKVAKVAARLKVVFLQFTSFIRAGAVMDNKYLLHALHHIPKIKMAQENCGIARRKAKGYYDTDIARSLSENIKHEKSVYDKIIDASLWGAGAADNLTMGVLWNACELEIRDTRKDLKVGSPEFNEAIGKRLREVIYRTQVVDSLLTRSSNMRSKAGLVKMYTSFASEPTLSLNLALDTIVTTQLDAREMGGFKKSLEKNGKYVRKATIAYLVTAAVTAVMEAAFTWLYDYDDDERDENFGWDILKNSFLNLSITNKIPFVKEIWNFFQGYSSSNLSAGGIEEIVKLAKEVFKLFQGDASMDKIIKLILQAGSDVTGIAAYNLVRDFKMIYYNLFGYDED